MVNNYARHTPSNDSCKIVHKCLTSIQHVSESAILAGTLQTLEQRLQKRNLLKLKGKCSFYPVWFLAETERNIFLWRHGYSLAQLDLFEFWIETESLILKRLKQLDRFQAENPFLNPLWGSVAIDPDSAQHEKEYLNDFLECLQPLTPHAHGLSVAASTVKRDLSGSSGQDVVVLPLHSTRN